MPLFRYVAYGRDGQQQQGQEFAGSERELERKLRARKLVLLECKEGSHSGVKQKNLERFISQLSPLLSSGIVIDRALHIIADDQGDAPVRDFSQRLREDVKRGQQLSEALESAGVADPLALTVVRAGEASGQLPSVLDTLEKYYTQLRKLKGEIAAALFYPAILVVLSLLSIILLGLYVIPTFKELFTDRLDSLPLNVRMIFAFSDFLVQYGLYTLAGVILAAVALRTGYKRSTAWRWWWSERILRLPGVGKFLAKIYVAQILSLLAVQLKNGVPMVSALNLIARATPNLLLRQRLDDIQNEVRRGKSLSSAMQRFPHIPLLAMRFLAIGEETGKLEQMAEKAGGHIANEVTMKSKAFANILGPLIIAVMGLIIAVIVVSMLTAVYSLTDIAQ